MPLTKWIHPLTRKEVELDHFDTDRSYNGRPAANPWVCRAAAVNARNDTRHAGLDLTATRTMGCPRQVYLETQFPFSLDPSKLDLRVRGTINHNGAEQWFNPDVFMTEVTDRDKMTIPVTIGGYELTMLADVIRKDMTEIIDMKFPNDFSLRFRKEQAKADHEVQLNLARLGLATQQWALDAGYDPDKVMLTVWDHACGPSEGSKALRARHMTEQQVLDHKAGGGVHTIEEILAAYAWMQDAHKECDGSDAGKRKVAGQLPLLGETMYNNKKCMMYCDMQKMCEQLVVEFGRPQVEFATEDSDV